ncbi:MAG: glutamine synthetase family protein [Planctomycetota bacterium]|nr:glutamine synthetase family protein [Planctomycetota bacterium]
MSEELVGMLEIEQLSRLVTNDEIETVIVVFPDLYGRFMGKRFDARFFLDSVASDGTHCCNYLLTVDMEMEPISGYSLANWEKGYGDFHMVPDLSTLRRASWLEKSALVICDLIDDKTHQPVHAAPRSILSAQVARADEAGFQVMAASELEYYLLEDSYREAHEKKYQNLTAAGWYIEDYHILQGTRLESFNAPARRHLRQSGVPVENSKGEWGLGQHELNVQYTDILQMADRHCIYKQCLKEIADQQEKSVTFMAKYAPDGAGSSSHMHLSLWRDSANAFAGDQELGPVHCSDTFRWFLGGWIAHAHEMMVCYGPTVNSYRRYQKGSWAPTSLAWSHDNRTAGFRVVGSGSSLRIECRIPGADCNPYLAFAAALASGLDGIENRIEPPPAFEGDVYSAEGLPQVPGSLKEATDAFADSHFARDAFGEATVDHYCHFFTTEYQAENSEDPHWDHKRYFERI